MLLQAARAPVPPAAVPQPDRTVPDAAGSMDEKLLCEMTFTWKWLSAMATVRTSELGCCRHQAGPPSGTLAWGTPTGTPPQAKGLRGLAWCQEASSGLRAKAWRPQGIWSWGGLGAAGAGAAPGLWEMCRVSLSAGFGVLPASPMSSLKRAADRQFQESPGACHVVIRSHCS